MRLGGTSPIHINVRLLCATNADIHAMVDRSEFRQDLLYRINTIELHIPPLRERGKDIELLAGHFCIASPRNIRKTSEAFPHPLYEN